MDYIRSLYLVLSSLHVFSSNKKLLNDDFENNFRVCQKVCNEIIKNSKVNYVVEGKDNLLEDEPMLIASNHVGFFDIAVLYSAMNSPMPFAAAKELMDNKVINDYIASINSVLIDRQTEDLKAMKAQLEAMEKAICSTGLILFPEGECSYGEGDIKDFKKGGFIAAYKNDISIVPTYINYEKIKRIGKLVTPIGEVKVIFDKPFKASNIEGKRVRANDLAKITRKKVLELKNNV